jgi:hypothetical protein
VTSCSSARSTSSSSTRVRRTSVRTTEYLQLSPAAPAIAAEAANAAAPRIHFTISGDLRHILGVVDRNSARVKQRHATRVDESGSDLRIGCHRNE